MRHIAKGKKNSKPPYFAQLSAELAEARAANDIARHDAIQSEIDAVKSAEQARYPQHFGKTAEDKARLLLLGWLDKKARHHFPDPGSFLEYECRWALVETLRRTDSVPPDILRLVASLFIPNERHGLAHPYLVARLVRSRAGALKNVYRAVQIAAAVEAYEKEGFKRDAAALEIAELYGVSREYVYQCLHETKSVS